MLVVPGFCEPQSAAAAELLVRFSGDQAERVGEIVDASGSGCFSANAESAEQVRIAQQVLNEVDPLVAKVGFRVGAGMGDEVAAGGWVDPEPAAEGVEVDADPLGGDTEGGDELVCGRAVRPGCEIGDDLGVVGHAFDADGGLAAASQS